MDPAEMVEAKDQRPGNMTDGDPALLEQERNPREGGKKQECGVREVRTKTPAAAESAGKCENGYWTKMQATPWEPRHNQQAEENVGKRAAAQIQWRGESWPFRAQGKAWHGWGLRQKGPRWAHWSVREMRRCPVFSGNQETGHLRRVGVSGVGWRRFEESKTLAEALRKMGQETSQGLQAALKAS